MSRSPALLALARRYARRRLARDLAGLFAEGLPRAREEARSAPLVLVANHVCWWDAFVLVAVDEALGTEGYALMDTDNLAKLPFFGRLGAIPLDPARPRAGLRLGADLLDRPGRAVWIFPQGSHRPAHLRPLGFRPGVRLLARLAPAAQVLPVSLQYAFGEGPTPAAYAALGEPISAARVAERGGEEVVERAVADGLARIDAALQGGATFPALVAARTRGGEGGLGSRLLSALPIVGRPA